jgi:hypothetical protein
MSTVDEIESFRPNVLFFLNYELSSPTCKTSSSHKNTEGFNNPRNDIILGSTEPANYTGSHISRLQEVISRYTQNRKASKRRNFKEYNIIPFYD